MKQKRKLTGRRSYLKVELDTELLIELNELKYKMKCRNWEEFFKKILEKREILISDVVAF